jgi:CRP-like cAMP-binding protein
MMKLACHELGEASKVITNLAQKPVRERLAEILLILKHTFGEDKEGYIDVSLTREEISNMTGTATESAIRLLSEFKADELILLDGKRIKILNAKKLAKIGMVEEEV